MNKQELAISQSQLFELSSNQITTINVTVKEQLDLEIRGLADSNGTLLINVFGKGTLNLHLNFDAYSKWSYLYMNESDEELVVNETVDISQNAEIIANYGELTKGKHIKKTMFNMNGHHSNLEVRGASITTNDLDLSYAVYHKAKDTYAMVKNYGIVFTGGKLNMEILGQILKGQSRSKTHQVTRIMNMEDKLKAQVFPKLIIDENDVEASHAASVGQPDPDAIYYLQSRGLTYEKTLEVITLGYLMPIVEVIEDESIREKLSDEINAKVVR